MRSSALLWGVATCLWLGCAKRSPEVAPKGHSARHRFDDAEKWAKEFEDPARDAWQKPAEVVAALQLKPADRVADVGSATGYFAVRLARQVPQGRVFGADIEPSMQSYLQSRADSLGLTNLTAVLASPESPNLPQPVDLVLIVNTYHHIDERVKYFRRLRKHLRPPGRIAVVDFRKGQPLGPPDAYKVAPDQVEAELQEAGYALRAHHGFLPNQYFLIFQDASAL